MKFLRILPDICANTTWSLPSSLTLKKAFGNLSTITPSAGIKSSFDNQEISFNKTESHFGRNRPARAARL